MDPLSISVGALAIIGAVDQSVKCLRKLSAIRKAPAELSAVHVEVSDLHAVLLLVAAVYQEKEEKCSSKRPPIGGGRAGGRGGVELERQVQANLERHSERAALALDDLNRIACDYATSLQSGKKLANGLAALSWIKSGRKRALELRVRLQEIRLNIVTTLGAKSRWVLPPTKFSNHCCSETQILITVSLPQRFNWTCRTNPRRESKPCRRELANCKQRQPNHRQFCRQPCLNYQRTRGAILGSISTFTLPTTRVQHPP